MRQLLAGLCGGVLLAGCGAGSVPQPAEPPVVPPVVVPPPSLFAQVEAIIVLRCVGCHSVSPALPGFATAPGGIRFDTPEQIHADARRIYYNVVQTEFMPYGNRTGMTAVERAVVAAWFEGGAK